MNYLAELKAFYDRLEINPLPSPAIALWHALMSIANKTGWQQEFTVAMSILVLKSGLSESAVKRARNRLTQDGFIKWKSRSGNQSAIYTLISFAVQYDPQIAPQSEPQTDPQSVPQTAPQSGRINKHKQNKTNIYGDDDVYTRACELANTLFRRYWGLSPVSADIENVRGHIISTDNQSVCVCDDKADLLEYAFMCSANANARNWGYVVGVLQRLKGRGIKTLDEAYEFDIAREGG